jgi:hypothetical protein
LLRIHRERIEAVIERDGLPAGVEDHEWAKVRDEERPERFLKRARKLGLDQLAPPPHGAGPPKPPSGLRGLRDLRDALRPTIEDRLEATHAPREERWRLIEDRIATRIRERLADPTWMPELEREPLTGLGDPALVEALRHHAGLENERSGFDRPRHEGGPGSRRGPGPR